MPLASLGAPSLIGAGSSILGGLVSGRAAGNAAGAQAAGLRQGNAALTDGRDRANAQLNPYAQGGGAAFSAQQALLGLGGDSASQMAALQNSPGYQFRLGEGLKGVQGSAAARGLLGSGATLKGLTQYGQDFASNEYDKRNSQLAGVAGLGYNASNQIGSNYMNTADSLNQNFGQIGEARAGGITGRANAITGAISGLSRAFGARK
jgi:hypothetical protein